MRNEQDLNNAAEGMKQAAKISIIFGILLGLMIIMPGRKNYGYGYP